MRSEDSARVALPNSRSSRHLGGDVIWARFVKILPRTVIGIGFTRLVPFNLCNP